LVWGNGGCSGDGTSNQRLLENIASYGYLAIASGAPKGSGSTTAAMMTASIDWAVKNAGQGVYANVDPTKIMAAGFSCGGVEAYAQIWDPRVKTIGIFSSGLLTNYTAAKSYTKPILYVIGGSSDVAYQNVSLSGLRPKPKRSRQSSSRAATLTRLPKGRARLQGSSGRHARLEGEPPRRTWWHPLQRQRGPLRQGGPQLARVAVPGRPDGCQLLHYRLQGRQLDRRGEGPGQDSAAYLSLTNRSPGSSGDGRNEALRMIFFAVHTSHREPGLYILYGPNTSLMDDDTRYFTRSQGLGRDRGTLQPIPRVSRGKVSSNGNSCTDQCKVNTFQPTACHRSHGVRESH